MNATLSRLYRALSDASNALDDYRSEVDLRDPRDREAKALDLWIDDCLGAVLLWQDEDAQAFEERA